MFCRDYCVSDCRFAVSRQRVIRDASAGNIVGSGVRVRRDRLAVYAGIYHRDKAATMRFEHAYSVFLTDTGFDDTDELRGALREFCENTKYINTIRRARKFSLHDLGRARRDERVRSAERCEKRILGMSKRWRTDITSLWKISHSSDLENVRKVQHFKRTLRRMVKTYGVEAVF